MTALCKQSSRSGPDIPVIDIMSIDPRKWDMMTCINQVSEPDHPIPLVASYDKHNRLLRQAWVAEDLSYPDSSMTALSAESQRQRLSQWERNKATELTQTITDRSKPELRSSRTAKQKQSKRRYRCIVREGPDSEPHRIRLLCWNLDGLDRRSIEDRMHAVCDTINKEKPHVVFLQEVIPLTLPILAEGCGMYQVIPGGDNRYFTAIMLRVGHVQFEESSVSPFPTSTMLRNLLSVKCRVKGIKFQMMTSHLESPVGASNYNDERKRQQVKAFEAMKEADHDRTVLFGGDTNMIDEEVGTLPEDIYDLWETTGQRADAKYTYDTRTNDNRAIPGYKLFMRLDRLYIRHCRPMSQVTQVDFELAGTDRLPCNRFPSDHYGIQAHFNINGVPQPT